MHWLFEHRIPHTPIINVIRKNPDRAMPTMGQKNFTFGLLMNSNIENASSPPEISRSMDIKTPNVF